MPDRHVAFYARVSTEGQARDNTIASQITALRERIAADGRQLEPDDAYVDEGYSGSVLVRPALERLRDAAAVALLSNFGPGVLTDFGPPAVPQPRVSWSDRGAWHGQESQSGFVRAAPTRA